MVLSESASTARPLGERTDAELQAELARASKIVATVQAEIEQRKADRLQLQAEHREVEAMRRRLAEREAELDERAAKHRRQAEPASSGSSTSSNPDHEQGRASADARSAHIHLKTFTQDGNELYFKCKRAAPLKQLMDSFCNRQGIATYSVRFVFDGSKIDERQTPEQLDMEDGDVLDVMFEQEGNVGEWESVPTSSGAEQLLLGAVTEDVDAATALDIERTASGPHLSRRALPASFESVDALLTTAQCARLVAHTEHLASELPPAQRAAPDAKLDVSADELAQLVGPGVLAALMRLGAAQLSEVRFRVTVTVTVGLGLGLGLGLTLTLPNPNPNPNQAHRAAHAVPSGLVLRRSAAAVDGGPARRIGWHHDWCLAVVSVALSDEHTGGRL